MPPAVIILVRHAQARHNLTKDTSLHDPVLTELGIEQCKALREALKQRLGEERNVAIIASPMKRTLRTALLSLDWLVSCGIPVEADANWQETTADPCNTGTPVAQLEADFLGVRFSGVDPAYPDKTSPGSPYAYTRSAVLARARSCVQNLHARTEKVVVVVSHSWFLRVGVTGRWFMHGDFRVFDFEHSPDTSEAYRLREHEDTNAGGLGRSRTARVEIGCGLPEEGREPDSAGPELPVALG